MGEGLKMSEPLIREANIVETGQSLYAVDIDVSGFLLKGDEPVASGGGGIGPAPYDMLLAALGECTVMTVRWFAKEQKWPLEKVEATVTHQKDGRTDVFTKKVTLHGDQLTPEQRAKLLDVANKCPVHRTLENTPVFKDVE
jgi:putative redox protein